MSCFVLITQADRERLQKGRVDLKDAHFTLATKSSIAKQQPVKAPSQTTQEEPTTPPPAPKPAWTPPGTPRSFHKAPTPRRDEDSDEEDDMRSPRSRGQSSRVHFKEGASGKRSEELDVEMAEREIARQAWLDSEVSRRVSIMT